MPQSREPSPAGQHPQRRPLATRQRPAARRVAAWLAAAKVSPNAVSWFGLLCGIGAGAALAATSLTEGPAARAAWIGGAALVQLRLAANMFDGMVAERLARSSPVGELYNEVPDRISDVATLVGLGYAAGGDVVLGFVAACVALFVAYTRAFGAGAGAGQEFCGPMAKPHRMFTVTVFALYCGVAPAAWQPRLGTGDWGPAAGCLALIIAGGLWTAGRRLRRVAATLREAGP
jgi:phosphatidylglycerophosphate synthase